MKASQRRKLPKCYKGGFAAGFTYCDKRWANTSITKNWGKVTCPDCLSKSSRIEMEWEAEYS